MAARASPTFALAASRSACSTASRPARTASNAASFTMLLNSAPENPGVSRATAASEAPGAKGTCLCSTCTSRIAKRPSSSGICTRTWRSKRPGRNKAESKTSGRFVAAITITGPTLAPFADDGVATSSARLPDVTPSVPPPPPPPQTALSKPSISVSSWFNVCSRSSLPRPPPVLDFASASSSSKKRMHGAHFSARWKRSRTRAAPRPTKTSTKSDAEQTMRLTPASCATARANKVFPVPGGPDSSTPLGQLAPRRR
mmetsp:Transcript_15757/g.44867  ORF Transcript_15757/g.44867 Transcript_15757/m.44867 type:complete len:257 (+) Transcript_15757:126-896(+)